MIFKAKRSKTGDSSGEPGGRTARRWFFRGTAALLVAGFLGGMVTMIVAEEFHIATSSTEFCTSCHSTMGEFTYKEFKESKHYNTPTGVRPQCGSCHVSHRVLHATWEHLLGAGDLFAQLTGDWDDPQKFEQARTAMAEKARLHLLKEDSHTCRHCHVMEAIKPTRKRGERAHADAIQKGKTNCIACHYNLVHKEAALTPAFTNAIKEFGAD